MSDLQTHRIRLKEIENTDLAKLYPICHSPTATNNWSPEIVTQQSEQSFADFITRRSNHRWDYVRALEDKVQDKIFGLAYCYNYSKISRTAYISLCLEHSAGLGNINIQAIYLYFNFLFYAAEVRKLFAEVFSYNKRCISLCEHLGLAKEGCLKEYQFWQNRYWDQLIYSLDRPSFEKLHKLNTPLLQKISCQLQTH